MALNLRHQTPAQFAARLRERYLRASREEAARLAQWILRGLARGDVTDAQVRTAFALSAGQWTTLKAKMQALADHYAAVQLAQGE